MNERFNAVGINGRDCPVCFRVGALTGERHLNALLTCGGCATAFRLVAFGGLVADTLERVTPAAPVVPFVNDDERK